MADGFFAKSLLHQRQPEPRFPQCGACGLKDTCLSPKMPPSGRGQERILIVAEAPGANEDAQNIQLCGEAGRHLERALDKFGIDMRRDCWLTNAIICRPPDNEKPTPQQIDYCRPNLTRTLEEFKPELILVMGDTAVHSVIGKVWRDSNIGGVGRWAGYQIPCTEPNAWICPTFHPSHVKRCLEERNPNPIPNMFFERHIKAALKLRGRPWQTTPDYKAQIEPIYDARLAALRIDKFIQQGYHVAFDYETNAKKPEGTDTMIVSCSVSDGIDTIAYPWHGEAIEATGRLLKSPLPKIASNMEFEQRWSRHFFGYGAVNWFWDTMQMAHAVDSRSGTASIKFQAFVLLGAESYNEHIEEFLEAKDGKKINRILDEIDIEDLLLYNGLDSLLEFKVAFIQRGILGFTDEETFCDRQLSSRVLAN